MVEEKKGIAVKDSGEYGSLSYSSEESTDFDSAFDEEVVEYETSFQYIKVFVLHLSNVIKSFLGSNWLGAPFAFSQSGIILGVVAVLMVSVLADYCCTLLVMVKRSINEAKVGGTYESGKWLPSFGHVKKRYPFPHNMDNAKPVTTYGEVVRVCCGKPAERVLDLALTMMQCSFLIGYFIFIVETGTEMVYSNLPDDEKGNNETFVRLGMTGLIYILVVPMVCIRDITMLGNTSFIGWVALMTGMVLVLSQFDLHSAGDVSYFKFGTLPLTLGIFTSGFEGIAMVLPVEHSIRHYGDPPSSRYPAMLHFSCQFCGACIAIVGIFGYLTFGDDTNQIVTLNLEQSPLVYVIQVTLMLAIFFTIPLITFPAGETIEMNIFGETHTHNVPGQKGPIFNSMRRNAITLITLAIVALIAFFVPQFGLVGGFVGALCGSSLSFIFPIVVYYCVFEVTVPRLIFHSLIFLFGVYIMVTGSLIAMFAIISTF
eukprot:CAMPEP_0119129034 /NCGR_PEP_ID=MMETSP1310-20130426/6953_1 /TAXON_ID=464262 /ORGANISM="Genus nov. species nov., Strain RCC2339" /LENGTH=483 /DNA_ID=CAMNT_0007119433 /DNA_START=170 /DNA_END=1621 /DNA_ORIENTATION=+